MARLKRFEHHRYLGVRSDMTVYDCDDAAQFAELERRVADEDLVVRNLIQAFGPDTLPEARNRGFRSV